jgi:DNA-binding HxlR family transcriptional regulator
MGRAVTDRRSGCPISYALDFLGDKWTLLVLRDLLLMNKRHYRELLAAEEGIATNILADRLKRLEAQGLINREADPGDRRQLIYRVTDKGISLVPVLLELAAWGARHDEKTAAPKAFAEEFRTDRDRVVSRFTDRLQED